VRPNPLSGLILEVPRLNLPLPTSGNASIQCATRRSGLIRVCPSGLPAASVLALGLYLHISRDASRISCASMPTRVSPIPNTGHWQMNSSGPAEGSAHDGLIVGSPTVATVR
jgi:hypothetical protein